MKTANTTHYAENTAAPACAANHISVAYRDTLAIEQASLTAPAGTITAIIGPNGAGKSTLLKAMLGVVKPLAGQTLFFGQPLQRVRNQVGYVPQTQNVDWDFPATVREVVLMGTYAQARFLRPLGKKQREAAQNALAQVGITDLADRQIGQLSGGQKQRVFLARCLAQTPDLLLLDEPFAGVDAASQQEILRVLFALRDSGKTIVLVHHDLLTVPEICDRVVLLNKRVIAAGTVETAFTQANIAATY
ncbi:MAG: ABC transporter ATP-binding protein, partial [Microbacteriaceae bacterium]|nr:ABC transporter ATP-binding protein [Microbacteriaceae bacterium]